MMSLSSGMIVLWWIILTIWILWAVGEMRIFRKNWYATRILWLDLEIYIHAHYLRIVLIYYKRSNETRIFSNFRRQLTTLR
jgi:hypothetical protein